jgi:hypothetical protein
MQMRRFTSPHECFQQKTVASESSRRFALRKLQFLPDAQQHPLHSCNGGWNHGSHLGNE